MIDPKLLTEENGFVEGVVVEIGYSPYKDRSLGTIYEYGKLRKIWPDSIETEQEDSPYGFDWIISIRPLTGPMAIWNFAPDYAQSAVVYCTGDIEWVGMPKEQVTVAVDSSCPLDSISERPFWAIEKTKEIM